MRIGVVGAGIIGLATARAVQRRHPDARVTVLDKEARIAAHQTGRNSGVVHAGIYYAPGSLKARLCVRGARLLRDFCAERGVAYEECGKLIVAATDQEVPRLRGLFERGEGNGVPGLRWLDREEIGEIEPHVTGVAAVHSPHTAIVDFVRVAEAYAADVRAGGGQIMLSAEVMGVTQTASNVRISTVRGDIEVDHLITCAGLYADRVARLAGDRVDPAIVPFRGEYWALRRPELVNGLVYPVPDPRYPFLGIHLTPQVGGSVVIGPSAVLAFAREGYTFATLRPGELWQTLRYGGFGRMARRHWRTGAQEIARSLSKRRFLADARRFLPMLTPGDLERAPAGVRAQAIGRDGELVDDFVINQNGRITYVRNAPSPAATSSLAIAEHIVDHMSSAADR